jgi:hypothetical protein
MEKEKKLILCATCGGEYDVSLVRCPYCGTAYAPAEEEEYMGQLEEIRSDLESHKEDGNKSLKSGLGTTVRIVILILALITLIILVSLFISGRVERSRSNRQKEEFLISQGIGTEQEQQTK